MAAGDEQYRLALTLFTEPEALWRTVSSLLDVGLLSEQMCLVAIAARLKKYAPVEPMVDRHDNRVSELYQALHCGFEGGGGQERLLTTGPLLQVVLAAEARGAASRMIDNVDAEFQSALLREVRRGLAALIVRSTASGQQLRVTRTLLRNTQQRVITYELLLPGSIATPR